MKKRTVIALCCAAAVILTAAVLFGSRLPKDMPPGLSVSGDSGPVEVPRGNYLWKTGWNSYADTDGTGPFELYEAGKLKSIKPDSGGRFRLEFENRPKTVEVVVYSESSAAERDAGSLMDRYVSGLEFTVPTDGTYIVNVLAIWSKGECYYYFCSTP